MGNKRMKRLGLFLLIFMMIISPSHVSAKSKSGITMKNSVLVVKKGKKIRLGYKILKKYKNRKIKWSSSNSKVVKVNKKGEITAKSKGKSVITARIKGTKYKSRSTVIVGKPIRKITSSQKSIQLYVGQSLQTKIKLTPSKASYQKLSYQSGNSRLVKVSSKGRITALAAGSSYIRVKTKDGSNLSLKIKVTVKKKTSSNQTANPPANGEQNQGQTGGNAGQTGGNAGQTGGNQNQPGDNQGQNSSGTSTTGEWTSTTYDQKIQAATSKSSKLLCYLEKYSAFIKYYGEYFYRDDNSTASTYQVALTKVQAGKSVAINCVTPLNWALKEIGLLPSGYIYGNRVKGFIISEEESQEILKENAYFTLVSDIENKNLQQAAEEGYFKPGDCVAVKRINENGNPLSHTVTYIGLSSEGHAMFYEAGNIPYHDGYSKCGCGPIDYYGRKSYYVIQIMRFKD